MMDNIAINEMKIINTLVKISAVFICLTFANGCQNVSLEHEEARNVNIRIIDFSKLKNGIFIGTYEGGMYKWRSNKTQVGIESGRVSNIELLESAEKVNPKPMYDQIIKKQSLEVDGIAGATLTSKALLKGVENALEKALILEEVK